MVSALTMKLYWLNFRSILSAAVTIALCGVLWLALDVLKNVAGRDAAIGLSAFVFMGGIIAFFLMGARRRQR